MEGTGIAGRWREIGDRMSGSGGVEARIHGIGSAGEGVGTLPDGRIVFVHRTAPGETVRIQIEEDRERWARGRLVELLETAPERREAPCAHYDRCGGCSLEHLAYTAQLHWKGTIVADALERIGGVEAPAPEVGPSPREFRYRSRVTFTLRRLGGNRVLAGFHEVGRPSRIVDVGGECLLPVESVAEAWAALRRSWGSGASRLPAGRELRLTLREVEGGTVLLVEGGRGEGEPRALLDAVPGLRAVWKVGDAAGARRLAGEEVTIRTAWGDRVPVGGSAFLQVNRRAAAVMEEAVLDAVGEVEGLRVVDAYCGLAPLGRELARRGATVTGIELDREAARGAGTDAPPGLTVLEGEVKARLPEALPADRILLNPPRAGLDRALPEIVCRNPAPRIVYVSCDPATLARDLDRLGDRYRLAGLRAFDLFPQTAHVETVAVLERRET